MIPTQMLCIFEYVICRMPLARTSTTYAQNLDANGVEILGVSEGIDTHGLPHETAISRLAKEHAFKVFA